MKDYIRLINKSEDYIENNLHSKITLDDLSQYLHVSKYHYHRIFTKYSRETLGQFISRIKIERSAVYVRMNKKLSITEIAHMYGYYDASSYCKAFKKYFKVTPTEFRKQQDFTINRTYHLL